ncbi:hypothetical protein HOD08_04700 [bacterium]|nr:hypothetical protein [bacterium]
MKKIFIFCALVSLFFSAAHAGQGMSSDGQLGTFRIRSKNSFDTFFRKIRRGMQANATRADKDNLEKVKQITELYCGWLDIDTLPKEIGQLKSLTALHLKYNKLVSLPHEIKQLRNLQHLDVSNNHLVRLTKRIGQLTSLKTLDLGRNQLISLPSEIGQLKNLQLLDLEDNKRISLPPEIGHLTNLQKICLCGNELTSLPPEIWQLTNLKYLHLYNNKLISLPPEIGLLKKLTHLHLERNYLATLPPQIGHLKKLTHLNLYNNHKLEALLPEIWQLKKLTNLSLGHNQLATLPPEIGQLTNLQELCLRNNELITLPPEIGLLTNLYWLYLSNSKIEYIPPELYKWRNSFLSHLDGSVFLEPPVPMPRDGVLEFDHPVREQWFWRKCKNNSNFKAQMRAEVKTVNRTELLKNANPPQTENQREGFVDKVGYGRMNFLECTSIEQLNKFHDMFEFDEAFREKAQNQIQVMRLQGLGITEVPDCIFELKNLDRLFLDDNNITELPIEIGNLKKLTFLTLGNNNLHKLPSSLRKLKKLGGIILDCNPLDTNSLLPNFARLPLLQFVSIDVGVARRLKLKPLNDNQSEIMKRGIPNVSVLVDPRSFSKAWHRVSYPTKCFERRLRPACLGLAQPTRHSKNNS